MTMVITSITEWQRIRATMFSMNKSLGLFMTMGNLHAGHIHLLQRSLADNDTTVMSLFVNPTQFNDKNDFKNYPCTLDNDIKLCEEIGVDYILYLEYEDYYPDDYQYQIQETQISKLFEGEIRLGHFVGAMTIIMKVILLTKAHRCYFSEKDYQQLLLVQGLVKAFFLDIDVVACPIIRDAYGVPHSSRNNLLSESAYALAKQFINIFHTYKDNKVIQDKLGKIKIKVEYVADFKGRKIIAVQIGKIRLIDNIEIDKIAANENR